MEKASNYNGRWLVCLWLKFKTQERRGATSGKWKIIRGFLIGIADIPPKSPKMNNLHVCFQCRN